MGQEGGLRRAWAACGGAARRGRRSGATPRAATRTTSLVVDAHLDAIYGAGMLDNASGSATILDIAQKMKNVTPANKLRFIWFGGEELGLLGLGLLRPQPRRRRAESHRLRPRRRRDRDAELPRSASSIRPAPDLFGRTPSRRRSRTRSTSRRRSRATQASTYFDSIGKNHVFLAGRNRRVQVQHGRDPGQRRADRAGLLQDAGRSRPVRRLHSATSRATSRASTGAASTTRSAGATTSATTIRRC